MVKENNIGSLYTFEEIMESEGNHQCQFCEVWYHEDDEVVKCEDCVQWYCLDSIDEHSCLEDLDSFETWPLGHRGPLGNM